MLKLLELGRHVSLFDHFLRSCKTMAGLVLLDHFCPHLFFLRYHFNFLPQFQNPFNF